MRSSLFFFFFPVLLCGMVFTGVVVRAQNKPQAVKGLVESDEGVPLEGVTVTVSGKGRAFVKTTETDAKGIFNFPRLNANSVYSFSFSSVGYDKKVLGGYTYHEGDVITLSVRLTPAKQTLNDVVVVGYGTEKKANLTGAVDQVGSEAFDDRPMPNVTRGLEGMIPNLNIAVTDGKPTAGSVYNIRGTTSIGAGQNQGALTLIDGVPGDPTTLNPNDIASVTVLKDAASAAVYGARGVFGVVLFTTKTPSQKFNISYNPSFGLDARTTNPKLVNNGYDYAVDFDSAYQSWYDFLSQPSNINTVVAFSPAYLDSLRVHNSNPSLPKVTVNPQTGAYQYFGNTDWQKELYAKNIPVTEQALSVSGGNDKAYFTISGRYYYQSGIFRQNTDNFDRYNLRVKGLVKATPWLSFNSNSDFSAYNYHYPVNPVTGANIWQELFSSSPTVAVMNNPDGSLTQAAAYGVGGFFTGNSYTLTKQYFVRNTLGFQATILPKILELNGDFSYLYTNTSTTSKDYPVQYSTAPGVTISSPNNYLTVTNQPDNYYAANLYAAYHQSFGLHRLGLTVGGNLESEITDSQKVQKNGLIVSDLNDLNLATGTVTAVTGGGYQWATAGIFYRANYSWADKYLLELDGRYDGSSKFPTSQQFGFFPSASAGWRINRESFMQGLRGWLDNWKLRASYGSLGNGQIPPYLFLPIIKSGTTSTIINGNFQNYLASPNVIPNGMTWEKSTTADFGTDIDVLHRRLSASVDWYERKTTGMITQSTPLPSVFGAATPTGNYADLKTTGYEISLNWSDQIKGHHPITYGVRVTFSDNITRITKYNNPTGSLTDLTKNTNFYTGERMGEIWGFVTDGFFTSQDDIAKHANQKNYVTVSNANLVLPGDIRFRDLNGDSVINNGANTRSNPGDQKIIGNSSPRYRFGISPFISWNNISLSAFFQGVGHEDWWPGTEANFFWGQYNRPYSLVPVATLNHWTPQNPNAYFPRYRGYVALSGTRELAIVQTRYLQNAAYIRLKNLSVAYSLPASTVERMHLQGLRIYFTGQNMWTYSPMFKHTKAFDPEVLGYDPSGGSGNGNDYPMLKTYTLGLNLTF